jgi:rhamnulokinase
MPFNTLFQLAAARKAEPRLFDAAERLLFLPDLFHYWLSDVQAVERTIASTSSMLDVRTGDWDRELVASIGVDPRLLGPIVEPGTPLGVLRRDVADETSAPHDVRVIAPASHDTASAVAAAPSSGQPGAWAYLSSGTWSLLGAELTAPHVTDASAEAPFTHERGVYGTIRFLKNIAGLWLVQELRRELAAAGEELSFAELARQAEAAPRFRTLVNPNDARFAAPGPMRPRIVAMAKETGQPAPETSGQFARACFESLALCYGQTVDLLSQIVGQAPQALHIVGGGSQNRLLNTLTAGAVGCRVTAGPAEATAAGNALVQAIGREVVPDLRELRAIVARSFDVEFVPAPTRDDAWRAARDRYDQLTA